VEAPSPRSCSWRYAGGEAAMPRLEERRNGEEAERGTG